MRQGACDSSLRPAIHIADRKDLEALIELETVCFKEETFHRRQLGYLLNKARSIVLKAEIEGRIIGSILILLRTNIRNARIYSLNVHPEYRRKGIGSLLMDEAMQLLKKKGFRKITLEVGINNHAAQNLYFSKGFIEDKILRNYYKNGDDAKHLVKEL